MGQFVFHAKGKHDLELRGAVNLLDKAIMHVGEREYNEWVNGFTPDPSIVVAVALLRNAKRLVERDLRRVQGR